MPPSGFKVPGDTPIALPTEEARELMGVRRADWKRLRRRIGLLRDPVENAPTWAQTVLGVSIGAGVALIPLLAGSEDPAQWAVVVLICIAVFSFLCFLFFRAVEDAQRADRATEVEDVCADMDEIEKHTPRYEAVETITSDARGLDDLLGPPRSQRPSPPKRRASPS
jgi:hypothetical protein